MGRYTVTVEVEARQVGAEPLDGLLAWLHENGVRYIAEHHGPTIRFDGARGQEVANSGDWVVKFFGGTFGVRDDQTFRATYVEA